MKHSKFMEKPIVSIMPVVYVVMAQDIVGTGIEYLEKTERGLKLTLHGRKLFVDY